MRYACALSGLGYILPIDRQNLFDSYEPGSPRRLSTASIKKVIEYLQCTVPNFGMLQSVQGDHTHKAITSTMTAQSNETTASLILSINSIAGNTCDFASESVHFPLQEKIWRKPLITFSCCQL